MRLTCNYNAFETQLQWFGTQEAVPGKQEDAQRKETRDQSFFKLSLRSFYWIEQGEETKKNTSKCRYFFRSNGVCIVLWRHKIKREAPALK